MKSLSTVVLNSRDRQGNVWLPYKCTWINSIAIVSAENILTWITFEHCFTQIVKETGKLINICMCPHNGQYNYHSILLCIIGPSGALQKLQLKLYLC